MSAFDHDNILKLLGIVIESKYSFMVLKTSVSNLAREDFEGRGRNYECLWPW